MQTNIPNVFAAGDVVSFPVALLDGERSSIHHQQVAEAHGETVRLRAFQLPSQTGTEGIESQKLQGWKRSSRSSAPSSDSVPASAGCCKPPYGRGRGRLLAEEANPAVGEQAGDHSVPLRVLFGAGPADVSYPTTPGTN